mmetsp:Transcript_31604/g.39331  ORF Transcript_31604/g.39331 Transcript_31604/m.39331 type:complete len:149 (-) Transcript_31604:2608-3054(-)
MHYSTYHPTHRSLDHAHDDQHDVEPVHFHEHAVLKAFDHPDSHDYQHTDPHLLAESHDASSHYYDRHYKADDEHPNPDPIRHTHHPRVYDATQHQQYWTTHEAPEHAAHSISLHMAQAAHDVHAAASVAHDAHTVYGEALHGLHNVYS